MGAEHSVKVGHLLAARQHPECIHHTLGVIAGRGHQIEAHPIGFRLVLLRILDAHQDRVGEAGEVPCKVPRAQDSQKDRQRQLSFHPVAFLRGPVLVADVRDLVAEDAGEFVQGFHLVQQARVEEDWAAGQGEGVYLPAINDIEGVLKGPLFAFGFGDLVDDLLTELAHSPDPDVGIRKDLFLLADLGGRVFANLELIFDARPEVNCPCRGQKGQGAHGDGNGWVAHRKSDEASPAQVSRRISRKTLAEARAFLHE